MSQKQKQACRKRTGDDSKPCSVTMPKQLQEAVIRRADVEDRSFSATIRKALEMYLSRPA